MRIAPFAQVVPLPVINIIIDIMIHETECPGDANVVKSKVCRLSFVKTVEEKKHQENLRLFHMVIGAVECARKKLC